MQWGFIFLLKLVGIELMLQLFGFRIKKNPLSFVICSFFGTLLFALSGKLPSLSILPNELWLAAIGLCAIGIALLSSQGKNRIAATLLAYIGCNIIYIQAAMAAFFIPMTYYKSLELIIFEDVGTFVILVFAVILQRASKKQFLPLSELKRKQVSMLIGSTLAFCVFITAVRVYQSYGSNAPAVVPSAQPITSQERARSLEEHTVILLLNSIVIFGIAFFSRRMIDNNSLQEYIILADTYKALQEKQEQYFELMLSKEQETKLFRHDIKNHFACLYYLLKKEDYIEAQKYLSTIADAANRLRPVLETGNDIFNAVINDINNRFYMVNFRINLIGTFPSETKLSSVDICTIFSNILSNAVESIALMNADTAQEITIVIKTIHTSLYIEIKNPCKGEVHFKGKLPLSVKSDKKLHGFGTVNIAECCHKYSGDAVFSQNEGIFTTEITLAFVLPAETRFTTISPTGISDSTVDSSDLSA